MSDELFIAQQRCDDRRREAAEYRLAKQAARGRTPTGRLRHLRGRLQLALRMRPAVSGR
ncbi:MAG TPA: hypothetical protein VIA06_08985 [Candidatus Dormibacteraeota bacterium]|nr:hypothetical protein [Candidatus Dormibacteraeota bacterium]